MSHLIIPKSDNDKYETNLDQDRREAYEDHAKDEVPKLKNINAILAYDYFKYGWDAAIRKYSPPKVVSKSIGEEFNDATKIQIACIMATSNDTAQKLEGREFIRRFLNS